LARVRCGDAGRKLDGYWGAGYWNTNPPAGRKLIEHHTITTGVDVAALRKKKHRALIIVPPDLFAAARAILDPGKKFGVIEMPPDDPMQILPNWLCASQSVPDALARCLAVFGDGRMPLEQFPPEPWDVESRDPLPNDSWYDRNPLQPKDIVVNPWVRKSIASGVWLEPYSGYRERMTPYDLWRPLDAFVPNGDLTALIDLAESISIPVAID
jgi:hypothetical protein